MLRVHTDVFMKVYWYSINSVTTIVVTPSPDQGHKTSLHALASLPSQQHSRLNTTFTSTATLSAMAATSMAITLYVAQTHLTVAGVLMFTPLGTTHVPPLHATQRVTPAHTPRLSVLHAPALTKHTPPSALSVLLLSPTRRVGRMMRCTSTGGLSPFPLTYIWWLSFILCCPQGRPLCFLLLVMLCAMEMAPLLSLHSGFGTLLFPHGLQPIV